MGQEHSLGYGAATIQRLASRTPGVLRRQLWVWPLLAAAMLTFVGLWVRVRMEAAMQTQVATNLKTILEANAEALRDWAATVKSQAQLLAEEEGLRLPLVGLLQRFEGQSMTAAVLLSAPELATVRERLARAVRARGFSDYVVLSTNLVVVAGGREQYVGISAPPEYREPFQACFAGQTRLSLPFPSVALQPDEQGKMRAGVPTMFVIAPVHAADGKVVAALGLRIVPEKDFTRILATARAGTSGETYAFNRTGLLLSQSRFDPQLKRLGLLPDSAEARSILTLELRDPQVELARGKVSAQRSELALIKPVREAVAGRPGVDVGGYRDYRGVRVVGAWMWLPDFDLGLVTQMDAAEAFAPARVIRTAFWFLFALLTLGSAVVFVLMRVAGHWQATAHQAAQKAEQLGQYTLDDEIGSGGFGTVFHAHHALMRRPVAVKVLDPTADPSATARFEREVQLTCQLTHPNTIALYDYGRTPDGLFYYAMEYLEGLSLDKLVSRYGPLPEGRVIHILRQVCASLAEAHAQGLIHRDIKPQNILLTRRGGIPDFVKVLDFGLVKGPAQAGQMEVTAANAILGSPLYMSPESIESPGMVGPPSDLYALGTVGYVLLTADTVFHGGTYGEVLLQQIRAQPESPSTRLKKPISPDLENLILQCLAKKASARPPSAAALEESLGRCAGSGTWTRPMAEQWWNEHLAEFKGKAQAAPKSQSPPAKQVAVEAAAFFR